MSLPPVIVEPFAGLAALTNHLFWLTPPCSRLGTKTAYSAVIARELELERRPARVILAATDIALVVALRALFQRPQQREQQMAALAR